MISARRNLTYTERRNRNLVIFGLGASLGLVGGILLTVTVTGLWR